MKQNFFICLYFIIAFHSIGLSCYLFQQGSARITLPYAPLTQLDSSDFTIDMYVYGIEDNVPSTLTLLSNRPFFSSGFRIGLHEATDSSKYKMLFFDYKGVKYMHKDNGAYNNRILSTGCHQITITLSGTTLSMYVDAILIGTNKITNKLKFSTSSPLLLGYDKISNSGFGGHISHVRFWKSGKTQEEVKRDLKSLTDPKNLVAYWPLVNHYYEEGKGEVKEVISGANGFLGTSPNNNDFEPDFVSSCCLSEQMIIEPNQQLFYDGLDDFSTITDNNLIHSSEINYQTIDFIFTSQNMGLGEFPLLSTMTTSGNDGFCISLVKEDSNLVSIKLKISDKNFIFNNPELKIIIETSLCIHVAFVIEIGAITYYLNGKKMSTVYYFDDLNVKESNLLFVGHDQFSKTYFKGTIGQIRIWWSALYDHEIIESMNKKTISSIDIGVEALMNVFINQRQINPFTLSTITLGSIPNVEDSDPTIIDELCKLSTGVNDESEKQHLSISISPNPNNGYFEFAHPSNDMSMTIYNALGKVVCQHILINRKSMLI